MSASDSAIRSVTLRILRDGPTHNHLLSPLTPYLAEVGPYEVVTIRVPYEHRRLLRDLDALRYGASKDRAPDVSRINAPDRRIIGDEIGEILGAVPGLTAEMATDAACDPPLTHLNLVFAAAELSLLPFELATAPRGFPGEGMPLSVQSIAPVVMTRSIPSAMGRNCKWGRAPKVLFVAAHPPGFRAVPVQAHLLALLRALEPWVGPFASDEMPEAAAAAAAAVKKHLTFLPEASLGQIDQACRTTQFTHIHILAHSQSTDDAGQPQYALALHGERGGKELVGAERLQAALRLPMGRRHDDDALSHPLVVSLATCDSGNQAQVIVPSMSLAHALHAAGVPLVVGSLFPLSYAGSTVMVDSLYGGLLRGRDPRRVLYDMRHDLFRMSEETHDWGSVVAYASLPDASDFDAQVQATAFKASMARVKGWLTLGQSLSTTDPKLLVERVDAIDRRLEDAKLSIPTSGVYRLEGQGNLASTEKRRAEILWRAAQKLQSTVPERAELVTRSWAQLRSARECYRKASQIPRWIVTRPDGELLPTTHWVLTQVLSLTFVLELKVDWQAWWAAQFDAQTYLDPQLDRSDDRVTQQKGVMWAQASQTELYLLAFAASGSSSITDSTGPAPPKGDLERIAIAAAESHIEIARALAEPGAFESTKEQLRRYTNWWFDPSFIDRGSNNQAVVQRVSELAERLLAVFP